MKLVISRNGGAPVSTWAVRIVGCRWSRRSP